jgi:hypothetical protein
MHTPTQYYRSTPSAQLICSLYPKRGEISDIIKKVGVLSMEKEFDPALKAVDE